MTRSSKAPPLTGKNPRTGEQCYGLYYNAGVAVHQLLYFLGRGAITFGANGHTFYVSAGEYAIAAKTRQADAAWTALKFLSGPMAQKFLFDNFAALPSWKDQNWLTAATDPYGPPFLAAAAAAKEAFFPEFMFQTYRPWLNATLSNAIAGKSYDLDAGLAQMQQQAQQWVTANYTVQNGQVLPK